MIIDRIKNADLYTGLHAHFQKAFDFLRRENLADMEDGRHTVCGSEVYALVQTYETLPADEGHHEAHRKYIDLQYVVEGEEYVGYYPLKNQNVAQEYCDDKDFALYNESSTSFILLSAGMFVILFPDDAHKPGRYLENSGKVKKIVLKIAV